MPEHPLERLFGPLPRLRIVITAIKEENGVRIETGTPPEGDLDGSIDLIAEGRKDVTGDIGISGGESHGQG